MKLVNWDISYAANKLGMVVCACNPNWAGGKVRRMQTEASKCKVLVQTLAVPASPQKTPTKQQKTAKW
jgi:hypothetical protein